MRQRAQIDRGDEFRAIQSAVAQMIGSGGRSRREGREIVERLMMGLEIRVGLDFRAAERDVPGAGVPGPGDALGAEKIADGRLGLRRQGVAGFEGSA